MVVHSTKYCKPPIICILIKETFQPNRQLHFLESMPSRFGFFLVLGGLYIPLLSHCIVKYDLFITDLSIQTLNSALTPCRRTQPSNSSRSLHLAFVLKNEAVSRPSQITLIGVFRFFNFTNASFKWNIDFKRFHINSWFYIAESITGSFIFGWFRFNVITRHIVNHLTIYLLKKKITKEE